MKKCPNCDNNKNTIRAGIRNTKQGPIQKYYCKNCKKYFTEKTQAHIQYPLKIILYALETYNKGYPVKKVKTLTGRKYKYSPAIRTIYSWINAYKDILPMLKLRKNFNISPDEVITSHRFLHQQIYPFTYHKLKLNLYSKKLPQLKRYINWVERSLPTKMFLSGPRASTIKLDCLLKAKQKDSIIPKLSKLALSTNEKPKNAHETIERFFMINDSATVCTELPVFINPKEIDSITIDSPLTGHIDLIQIKYEKLYILDYKPNLNHPERYASQLYLYKKAVHMRTTIPEKNIIPVVFNEYAYYELV